MSKFNQCKEALRAINETIRTIKTGTWFIRNTSGNPTYYQFSKTEGGSIILERFGHRFGFTVESFFNDFSEASESQVSQHLNYLDSKGLDYVGINPNKKVGLDPTKCEFYLVTCRGIHGAKVRHTSYEVAEQEAIRIAKKENHETWILGVVAKVKPNCVVTHEVVKRF